MKVGFTGTQIGMSTNQLQELRDALRWFIWRHGITEARHGDCIGGDEQFHNLCVALTLIPKIIIHPPINESKRAWCLKQTLRYTRSSWNNPEPMTIIELPAKEYIPRNHDIVDSIDYLFVAPKADVEELRSGTWATYRYAKKFKPYHILRR